jgi:hypothetical protein
VRLIIHQTLKDVRLLRWLLAAWVLLLVAIHGLVIFAGHAQQMDSQALYRMSVAETTFVALATAVFIVMGALLVQNDSPVSNTAFWLTRPLSAGSMLVSKLLFALVILVALPLLLDFADFALARLSLRWLPPEAVAYQLAWLLPLMAVAAITVGLPRFVLIALFEIALFTGVTAVATSVGMRFWRMSPPVMTVTLALLGTALFVHPYLTRHLRSSAVLFGMAPVLLVAAWALGPGTYPTEGPRGGEKDYPDARQSGISVALDPSSLTAFKLAVDTTIQARLTIGGLPPDRQVYVSARGWFEVDSKHIPLGTASAWRPAPYPRVSGSEAARVMAPVLARTTLLNPGGVVYPPPSISLSMSSADFDRVKNRAGRLHVDLLLDVYRYQADATVAPRPGSTFDAAGTHREVLEVRSNASHASVVVREAQSRSGRFVSWTNTYVLRNLHLGQSVIGYGRERHAFGIGSNYLGLVLMIMPVPLHVAVTWNTVDFDFVQANAVTFRAEDWLQGADLVIVSRPSAGRWRASVDLPEIRLADIPTSGLIK